MTDLDRTLDAAIRSEAARAVAPPLAAVERRYRAYRARRAAVAAAAAVVAVAGVAVAVPRFGGTTGSGPTAHGRLRPYDEFARDADARAAYVRCRDAHRTVVPDHPVRWTVSPEDTVACFHAVGYEAPPGSVTPTAGECGRPGKPVTLVASGRSGGGAWAYSVFPAHTEDVVCQRVAYEGRLVNQTSMEGRSAEPSITTLADSGWALVHSDVPATVERVTITIGDREYQARAVSAEGIPGRRFYAVAVEWPGGVVIVTEDAYDGAGTLVRGGDSAVNLSGESDSAAATESVVPAS